LVNSEFLYSCAVSLQVFLRRQRSSVAEIT